MPTNEQRRATAKRKLDRQLERRAAQARRRRLYTIIGSIVGVIVVVAAVIGIVIFTKHKSDETTAAAGSTPGGVEQAVAHADELNRVGRQVIRDALGCLKFGH